MLSKTVFDHVLVMQVGGMFYETSCVIGCPMILFDTDLGGMPIASIHFESYEVPPEYGIERFRHANLQKNNSSIVQHDRSLFQGVTGSERSLVSFVITNLLFEGDIAVNICKYGTDELINDINVFEPGTSLRVTGDASDGNKIFILERGMSNAPSNLHKSGIYFNVAVFPLQKGRSFKNARWACIDLFCRPRKMQDMLKDREREFEQQQNKPMEEELTIYEEGGTVPIDFFISVGIVERGPDIAPVAMIDRAITITRDAVIEQSSMFLKSFDRGDKIKEENCVICLDGKPDVTFSPCGHCVVHIKCQLESKSDSCPVCRQFIYTCLGL